MNNFSFSETPKNDIYGYIKIDKIEHAFFTNGKQIFIEFNREKIMKGFDSEKISLHIQYKVWGSEDFFTEGLFYSSKDYIICIPYFLLKSNFMILYNITIREGELLKKKLSFYKFFNPMQLSKNNINMSIKYKKKPVFSIPVENYTEITDLNDNSSLSSDSSDDSKNVTSSNILENNHFLTFDNCINTREYDIWLKTPSADIVISDNDNLQSKVKIIQNFYRNKIKKKCIKLSNIY